MVLNTEWAQVEVIDLINDGSGLAFGIIGGRSTGVVVKTILPGGVADRDGRLQSGDHILQIGDVNLRGLGSEQVASVLRQCGVHVRMVVARPVEPTSSDYQALGSHAPIVPTKLLGDPEELDRHLIEHGYTETFSHALTQPNFPDDTYIYSRTSSELDIHPLSGIVDVVKDPLPIGPIPIIPIAPSRTPSASTVELLPLDMALRGQPLPETETFDVQLHKDDYGLGITVAGYVCEKEELSGIFIKSISAGSAAALCRKIQVNDRIVQVGNQSLQGFTNHQAVELLRHTGPIVKLRLERYLRGPKYEQLQQAIRANQLKPPSPPSPSVSSLPKFSVITDGYSVTEIELEGESHTTITSSVFVDNNQQQYHNATILATQLHQRQHTNLIDDENIEIVLDEPSNNFHITNNTVIKSINLSPMDKKLQEKWCEILGRDMDIIVAHLTKDSKGGLGISLEGTVDVEDGREVRPHHYIRSILPDGPVGMNGLLESGDELLEVNGTLLLGLNHLEVVRCLKNLPQNVILVCARHSEHSALHRIINTSQDRAAFATRSILGGSLQNLIASTEISRLVKAKSDSSLTSSAATAGELSGSRSKSRSLEPVTGLAAWSDEPHVIELQKGERGGLGFSILDYQDPVNPAETVIVIRSLVPGGVAQTDGRLIPGDRLLAVNNTPLARASLDKAVQVLKSAPKGPVQIEIAKPLPCHDTVSQSSQISSLSFQECIDDAADDTEDPTCLDDYQECLEEYQEGLEVVQICVEEKNGENSLATPHSTSINSLISSTSSEHRINNKITSPSSTSSTKQISSNNSSKKMFKHNKNHVQEQISSPTTATTTATDLETKYKIELSQCLRVRESSDEKDGYETCLEDIDSSDISITNDVCSNEQVVSNNNNNINQSNSDLKLDLLNNSNEHLSETKLYSKKDHVCLNLNSPKSDSDYGDQLKSYDEQSDSFGSDQFFLVQYIDDEEPDRSLGTERLEQIDEEEATLTNRHHHNSTTDKQPHNTKQQPVATDIVEVQPRATPRRYVRCLSEYYNDYEEVLEECRALQQNNEQSTDNQEAINEPPEQSTTSQKEDETLQQQQDEVVYFISDDIDDTIVCSRDYSTDDFSESVNLNSLSQAAVRSFSAPDLLNLTSIKYLNTRDVNSACGDWCSDSKYRRKSAVPTTTTTVTNYCYEIDDSSLSMTVTRSVIDTGGGHTTGDTATEIMADSHWGPQRLVQVIRPPTGGSLGISIVGGKVDLYNAESVLGIFVKNVVPQSPAGLTGELKTGDRILEVDGVNLRNASHEKAVEAIRSAGNPVSFLVQSLVPWGESDTQSLPNNIENDLIGLPSSPTPSIGSRKLANRTPTPHINQSRTPEPGKTQGGTVPEIRCSSAAPELPTEPPPDSPVLSRPSSARGMRPEDPEVIDEEPPATTSKPKSKYSDSEDESSDEEDTRDQEGRMYTAKGQEIDRASAGNVKRSKDEVAADPEEEDDFGYTTNKVKKKYNNLGGSVLMVQLERSPQGSLGLSLAGHRDRNTMAVFVVGINPNGAAHRLGPAGIQVGDEILEVNGIVLHGRCHLNASAIIKGLSGPTFKVIVLRKKSALDDLAVRPITQFPVTLEDEQTAEERFSNFKNVRTVTLKKGTQSLGIMIIEGKHAEVGQGIFISDIQEGSAAEKAGLDIGDMILAVNKDTLVNASYDTAASILKKTEGLVVLVVCNPNKRTENDATGPSAGGAGAKASAKPPSRPTSSAGKAGGLKTSAPPSRPTTPISEPVADPATATILPGKETVIEITTEGKALGLSFVGGKDTLLPKGIIVNEVYPNGSLAKDGRVKPGDQLLEVNGVKLADVTYTTASCAIRQIQPKVRLTVIRPEKAEYSIIDVELTKKPGKGVGLGVMARKTEPGVYISDILQGSVADLDGRIMRGDAVISVNGVNLTTATAEQAAATLKTAAGKIAIKLQRYKPPAPR